MSTKEFFLPIYRVGLQVYYIGNKHSVDMVYVSGNNIMLKLSNIPELVNAKLVSGIEPTRFEI